MQPSINFDGVWKRYRIGRTLPTLRSFFKRRKVSNGQDFHWALRDVSFHLQPGDALGIIGPNGAGKTTILKLLSKVTYPTRGEISVKGRFSSLIELGAGFHPELTGRENIYLNGTILGMRRQEISQRFDQIVDFAGIGNYLDTPVKRYSSGMYARLGFAVAAHVDPEILLVDEVLAVGDMAFRKKCYERMRRLLDGGTTLVFVSHDFSAVQRVCSRAIVLYDGAIAFDGSAAQAVAEYSNILRERASSDYKESGFDKKGLAERRMTHGAKIEQVQLYTEDGTQSTVVRSGERVRLRVAVRFLEDAAHPVFACTLRDERGEVVYDTTTRMVNVESPSFKAGEWVMVEYSLDMHLLDGIYSISTDLAYHDLSCYYDYVADALSFVVQNGETARGVANLGAEIEFHRDSSPADTYVHMD